MFDSEIKHLIAFVNLETYVLKVKNLRESQHLIPRSANVERAL